VTTIRRALAAMTIAAVLMGIAFGFYALIKNRPQDVPWAPLDLAQPPGMFTAAKLATLRDEPGRCPALLERAGVRYEPLASVRRGASCGYSDGVRLERGGAWTIGFAPAGVGTSCPVAAALALFEWNVLQPAAERHFGARVVRIEHFGSYNCRRIYGRSQGDWSEHATANALDVAGLVLSDGTRASVIRDWKGEGPKARFLRDVRDGACRMFTTVLSPDYNAAHRDHLHLDLADRGAMGWRACR
jgi:hypothetical protein